MKQHILLTIISLLVFSAPAAAMASPVDPSAPLAESTEMQGINDEANHVDVSVSGTNIQVHAVNCQGATLKVYDIVGKLKYVAHIDSNDKWYVSRWERVYTYSTSTKPRDASA